MILKKPETSQEGCKSAAIRGNIEMVKKGGKQEKSNRERVSWKRMWPR